VHCSPSRRTTLHVVTAAIASNLTKPVTDPLHVVSSAAGDNACIGATETHEDAAAPKVAAFFALCCHHLCRWETLVGRHFLEKHNLNREDFAVVCCPGTTGYLPRRTMATTRLSGFSVTAA